VKVSVQIRDFSLCSTILFFVVGCGAWQELHFTKNKPKESDLIGTYEPDAKTRARITKNGGTASPKCQIKIYAEDKIEFLDMPVWWEGGSGNKELVSTNGIWRKMTVIGESPRNMTKQLISI
jgi:hypothetical protein